MMSRKALGMNHHESCRTLNAHEQKGPDTLARNGPRDTTSFKPTRLLFRSTFIFCFHFLAGSVPVFEATVPRKVCHFRDETRLILLLSETSRLYFTMFAHERNYFQPEYRSFAIFWFNFREILTIRGDYFDLIFMRKCLILTIRGD